MEKRGKEEGKGGKLEKGKMRGKKKEMKERKGEKRGEQMGKEKKGAKER